jgi:cyclopropane-fatty-acyl-phospholipid synthase
MLRRMHAWMYDELRQLGTDFEDPAEVGAYDEHQEVGEAERTALLDDLGVGEGTRLVEIGCGTGWLAIAAARRGAAVDAVDVSGAMLAAARRNAARAGVDDAVRFHRAGF